MPVLRLKNPEAKRHIIIETFPANKIVFLPNLNNRGSPNSDEKNTTRPITTPCTFTDMSPKVLKTVSE